MNSHDDSRRRERHAGPGYLRYPVGGDLTMLGNAIGGKLHVPTFRNNVPAETITLAQSINDPASMTGDGWSMKEFPDSAMRIYTKGGDSVVSFEGSRAFDGTSAQDGAITFRDVPINNTRGIARDPLMRSTESILASEMPALQEAGGSVKFVGHSLGGFRAKWFGNQYGVPQEVFNAHVFPHNTFPAAAEGASTTYHTIVNDPTNFKNYVTVAKPGETHYIYPPSESSAGPLDNHWVSSFTGPRKENYMRPPMITDRENVAYETPAEASSAVRARAAVETVNDISPSNPPETRAPPEPVDMSARLAEMETQIQSYEAVGEQPPYDLVNNYWRVRQGRPEIQEPPEPAPEIAEPANAATAEVDTDFIPVTEPGMPRPSNNFSRAGENVGTGVGVALSGYEAYKDFKNSDYLMGAANTVAAGSVLSKNPTAIAMSANLVSTAAYAEQARDYSRAGQKSMAAFKEGEAAVSGAGIAISAANPVYGGMVNEGVSAVDETMSAYSDIKHRGYSHAVAHGVEAVLLGAGAVGAVETGGLSLLVGGGLAYGVHKIDDAGIWLYHKTGDVGVIPYVGHKIEQGEKWVEDKFKAAGKWIGNKFHHGDKDKESKKRKIQPEQAAEDAYWDKKMRMDNAKYRAWLDANYDTEVTHNDSGHATVHTTHHPMSHRGSDSKTQSHAPTSVRGITATA